ncbi:LysR family transcriptional regulator [Galactobacter valiniphilus]|uniref:LysR family transcriptional regulator n=1 Tax=Galactobacter valiniphilus TaxID=2676122 RepID=UPI003734EC8F
MIPEQQPALTLRQAWHFVVAAESGTFAEAARRLHMAPSAISASVTELERTVGSSLLVKQRAKGVALTASGHEVLALARTLLATAGDIAALSGSERSQLRGRLTVGADISLGPTVIPPMLTEFAQQCPGVEVDFVEGFHREVQSLVLSGDADVAFVYGEQLDPQLAAVTAASAEAYALVPADHPLAAKDRAHLKDLAQEDLLLFDAPPAGERVLRLFREAELEPVIRHRSRSYATVRSLVSVGRGVGVLFQQPALNAPYAELGVRLLPLHHRGAPVRPLRVSLVSAKGTRPSPRAKAWIEVARELLHREAPAQTAAPERAG